MKMRYKLYTDRVVHESRPRNNTRIKKLVPRIGQTREAPMDTISIRSGIGLLLIGEQLALSDRVNGRMGVFSIFGQGRYVKKMDRYFHRIGHIGCHPKEPTVRSHFNWH